jgi:peptidoglycan/xylan/chitin deacetylase (PgdA/CDA1 family)
MRQWVGSSIEAARRARRRMASRPVILMYHRVTELHSDPQLLAVRPTHFAEQLGYLRDRFEILPLAHLADAVRRRGLPRRSVVITIDDGYFDTHATAYPLLRAVDAPATLFITTAQIGGVREFWWDELERIVLEPGRLPRIVRLAIAGEIAEWDLGHAANYTAEHHARDRSWNIEEANDPGARQQLYRALYARLHPLLDDAKWKVLEELRVLAGKSDVGRTSHRSLSVDELIRLSEDPAMEIGAHSATHPALAGLPRAAQLEEVDRSKSRLEEILGRPVTSFAYPHGSYDHATITAVAQAGFDCACTSDAVTVGPRTDALRLPRIVPRDWGAEMFGHWLRYWVG